MLLSGIHYIAHLTTSLSTLGHLFVRFHLFRERERERERERASSAPAGRGAEGEGERESQADSLLSMEPDIGLELMTPEIMT